MNDQSSDRQLLHATAIAIDKMGVLLTGPSGVGKSDLALQLIDRGATLISDDQVELERRGDEIFLNPPQQIAGKIEIHSLGIFDCTHVSAIPLRLKIELQQDPERYPMDRATQQLCGLPIAVARIDPRLASAPIKVEWALRRNLIAGTNQS